MNITAIIIAAAAVGGTGILVGLILGIAGERLKVEVDEREEKIMGIRDVPVLPQRSSKAKLRSVSVRSADRL